MCVAIKQKLSADFALHLIFQKSSCANHTTRVHICFLHVNTIINWYSWAIFEPDKIRSQNLIENVRIN